MISNRAIAAAMLLGSGCCALQASPDAQRPGNASHFRRAHSSADVSCPETPQPVAFNGGPVLSNVRVTVVFWGNQVDPDVQHGIGDFFRTITNSPYLDWLSEYNTPNGKTIGRGSLVGVTTLVPPSATTVKDEDLRLELTRQIIVGTVDPNSFYMVYLPPGVRVVRNPYSATCVPPDGGVVGECAYHDSFSIPGGTAYYGVVPDYKAGSGCERCAPGLLFDGVTAYSSHELGEAITDPDCSGQNAWCDEYFGEIGDSCECRTETVASSDPAHPYVVQTLWSNRRGACVARPDAGVSPKNRTRLLNQGPSR